VDRRHRIRRRALADHLGAHGIGDRERMPNATNQARIRDQPDGFSPSLGQAVFVIDQGCAGEQARQHREVECEDRVDVNQIVMISPQDTKKC